MHYYGFESIVLEGGYKAYRGAVHKSFNKKYDIKVLTGKTGSGKTEILHALTQQGAQVVDLEGLSQHRGSSFGALGMEPQPSQEQFENRLFEELNALDASKTIWIEDESRAIGDKVIPEGLWTQMKEAPMVEIHRTEEERMEQIVRDYGHFDIEELKVAMARIGKRLGPQHVKEALNHLDQNEISEAFEIALKYYDRAYAHLLSKRKKAEIKDVDGNQKEYSEIADELNRL
jgi:tRNA 2-selenouridine synthase